MKSIYLFIIKKNLLDIGILMSIYLIKIIGCFFNVWNKISIYCQVGDFIQFIKIKKKYVYKSNLYSFFQQLYLYYNFFICGLGDIKEEEMERF